MKYVLLIVLIILSISCFYIDESAQVILKNDPNLYIFEFGETLPTSASVFIEKATIEDVDFEICHQPDDLINDTYLQVGSYEAKICFLGHEIPFQITIQDTTCPTITLKQQSVTMQVGEVLSLDDFSQWVIVNDLSKTKEIEIISHIDFYKEGKYEVFFEVEDIYGNKSEQVKLEVMIESPPRIQEEIINKQNETTINLNICPNGQIKINSFKDCNEPAYDEYPDMIGSIDELRVYGNNNKLSYFITNITLNDGTETYGLWITE